MVVAGISRPVFAPPPARCVEAVAPGSPGAFPEPPLPFDRYLEVLNRIAARVDSESRLTPYAQRRPAPRPGRHLDVYA